MRGPLPLCLALPSPPAAGPPGHRPAGAAARPPERSMLLYSRVRSHQMKGAGRLGAPGASERRAPRAHAYLTTKRTRRGGKLFQTKPNNKKTTDKTPAFVRLSFSRWQKVSNPCRPSGARSDCL